MRVALGQAPRATHDYLSLSLRMPSSLLSSVIIWDLLRPGEFVNSRPRRLFPSPDTVLCPFIARIR